MRWVPRTENRVLNSVEIMSAIVERIGRKLNVSSEDVVYRRDNHRGFGPLSAASIPKYSASVTRPGHGQPHET